MTATTRAYVALAAAGCCWGTGFFFGKIGLRELAVAHMLAYRFAFGCIGLLVVLYAQRQPLRRADWSWVLLAAAIGVPLQFVVQFEGLARTTVTHASLIVGALPVMLAVAAAVFFGERLDRRGWMAITVSTIGVAAIMVAEPGATPAGGQPATLLGDLLVLVSLVAGVAWVLLNKRLIEHYPAGFISALVMVVGTALLLAYVVIVEGLPAVNLSMTVWATLVAQGLLATTAATLLWNWGLTRVPASRAGVFVNLEPVVGAVLGFAALHEAVTGWTLAGGAAIVWAALEISRSPRTSSSQW